MFIIKVGNSPDVWIITEGTNTDVLKAVSKKAVSEIPTCIGIMSWGNVYHKRKLKRFNKTVDYHISDFPIHFSDNAGMKLGQNHTHFLLVDDEHVNKFGGDIQFRTNLEHTMIDQERKCKQDILKY